MWNKGGVVWDDKKGLIWERWKAEPHMEYADYLTLGASVRLISSSSFGIAGAH